MRPRNLKTLKYNVFVKNNGFTKNKEGKISPLNPSRQFFLRGMGKGGHFCSLPNKPPHKSKGGGLFTAKTYLLQLTAEWSKKNFGSNTF